MIELWTELAGKAALTLDEAQDAKLSRYLELLVEANEKMNLTRIVDVDSARVQHIGDALTVLPYLPKGEHKLADVGSGGGVPGIPLAIARPDASITLIESTKKKAAFLKRAASELGLPNVKVLDLRAEDVGNGPLRETFDIAIARAVASLDWLAEWCLPLVKKKGTMLAMKGQKIVEELPAAERTIRLLGGMPAEVHPVVLPGSDHRVIVSIWKTGTTDPRYPRPATATKGKAIGE